MGKRGEGCWGAATGTRGMGTLGTTQETRNKCMAERRQACWGITVAHAGVKGVHAKVRLGAGQEAWAGVVVAWELWV